MGDGSPAAGSEHADQIRAELASHAEPEHAAALQRFFQTGPGGYGEGDVFHGIRTPHVRRVARRHGTASDDTLGLLLADRVHEHRFTALVILDERARRAARAADLAAQERLAHYYLEHLDAVDSWDLVDVSAPHVLGDWLAATTTATGPAGPGGPAGPAGPGAEPVTGLLDRLASSPSLWHRRIAMLATFAFVRDGRPAWALHVAERLADDSEDLVHKATGWLLREVGRRDPALMLGFLDEHGARLARVTVRYALERMPPEVRARYRTRAAGRSGNRPERRGGRARDREQVPAGGEGQAVAGTVLREGLDET